LQNRLEGILLYANQAQRLIPDFVVLLGGDYAGKSSAMARLAAAPGPWRLVSVDTDFLTAQYALLARLRRDVITDVVALDRWYSTDFLMTMLQTAAVHLRDRVIDHTQRTLTIVDSYYYKLLAKCRLAGIANDHPMLQWWRSFPQPRRVVYLERSLDSAWQRCSCGAALNRLEYYGAEPTRPAFDRYQADLDRAMRDEIKSIPVSVIEETTPDQTVRAIQEIINEHA
jgi:thymidylate kinase